MIEANTMNYRGVALSQERPATGWSAAMSHRGEGQLSGMHSSAISILNKSCSDSGFLISFLFFFGSGVLLFKSLYATGRIHKLLFACHKGMALRTYLNPYVLLGGLGLNYVSARAGNGRLLIFRVNTFLHCLQLSS